MKQIEKLQAKARQRFGFCGSLIIHFILFVALAFSGVFAMQPSAADADTVVFFDAGGGGGGGGTGGNTEGNGRYTPSTGGPGATTTITPEDVPLAPLPESPVDVTLIDDGEVPLAPLPKTGQTSKRTTLTMILSGIFVAVTALSRKRKEEDS